MSLSLVPLVWHMKPGVLTSSEKYVLLRLVDFAQEDGSSIYPSLSRIAQETSLSLRTVKRAITELLNKNVLQLIQPFTSRRPNTYQINVSFLRSVLKTPREEGHVVSYDGCHDDISDNFAPKMINDKVSTQGGHGDIPKTYDKRRRGVTMSPQGSHHVTSRGDTMTPNPLYKPLYNPLILLPVSADGHVGVEEQDKQIRRKQQPVKEPTQREMLVLEQFNQWYACYPRKVSRKKALAAFTQALKQVSFDKLLALTRAYAQEVENRDQQYIPYPATWLRGERWEEVEGMPMQEDSTPLSNQTLQNPAIDGRLQAFLDRYVHQVCNNAFAFKECQLKDEGDRIVLEASSPFYRDRVELFERELRKHFGKQVLITLADSKSQTIEPRSTSSLAEADFVEPRLRDFLANNPRIDSSMHFAFKGTALQETETTVTLFNTFAFCLSKVDFYLRELERFFGKRVTLVCGEKPDVRPKLKVLDSPPKAHQETVSRVSTSSPSPSYGERRERKQVAAA